MRAFASLLGSLILSAGLYGQNPDIDALQAVNVHRNQQLDPTFGFITQSAAPVSIAIPVLTTGIGFLAKDTSVFYKGLFIGETMAVSALITYGMKYGIDRERPYDTYPFIEGLFHEKTHRFLPDTHLLRLLQPQHSLWHFQNGT